MENLEQNTNSSDELANLSDTTAAYVEAPVTAAHDMPAPIQTEELASQIDEEEEHTLESEDHHEDYAAFTKQQLIDSFGDLIKSAEYAAIKNKVIAIRTSFWKLIQIEKEERLRLVSEEGVEKEDLEKSDPAIEKFNQLYAKYRQLRHKYLIDLEKDKENNLLAKQQILEQIKVLIDSGESLKKTYDDLKELQIKWKEVGPVSKADNDNLWKSYQFLIEKFFDKVKINNELKDLDLKKNLETKIDLCEKLELLLLEPSIMKSFKELQRLHELWRETGPVPSDKSQEIWDRFHTASEKIHARRKEYYEQQKEEREKNYQAKIAICEKIEEINTQPITTMRAWKKVSDEVLNLQNMWRTIGFAPEKLNDEVWHRFRSAVNVFFDTKKEFFGKLQDDFTTNYNLKLELCVKAEALQDSTDWNYTARDLIFLQKKWKEIGPVSQKHSEVIWKRFRTACDNFFNRKEEYFKNIDSIEANNLSQKEEIIKRINDFTPAEDNKQNIETLKNWQREWTDAGHVPVAHKDRMYDAYKDAIAKAYEKLNMTASEAGLVAFKSRMEPLMDNAEGERIIEREVQNLRKIIQKLTTDVTTLENNIGYFAKSKNADLLKQEFEKKIEYAKRDLKLNQDKLNFLTRRPKTNQTK